MKILRIEHVQLAMPPGEEAMAISFYEGILGIPHVAKPAHLEARGGCWFQDSDVKIHLGVEQDFRPARKAHPALLIDDLESLALSLSEHGYTPVSDLPLEGFHRLYVDDPFGNRIELLQTN